MRLEIGNLYICYIHPIDISYFSIIYKKLLLIAMVMLRFCAPMQQTKSVRRARFPCAGVACV